MIDIDNINKAIEIVKYFSKEEWNEFSRLSRRYNKCELPLADNPKTTSKDALELQQLLVQTVINFINERELNDINEIDFNADSLLISAKHGYWTPATDSYLGIMGISEKENVKFPIRNLIAESY
jgi:hypothetical protein